MNERRHAPFEVQAFTNLDSLEDFASQNHIELLLISTNAMCDRVKQMDVERIIILSEGETMTQRSTVSGRIPLSISISPPIS